MPTRPTAIDSNLAYVCKINGKPLYDYGVLTYRIPHLGQAMLDIAIDPYPERHDAWAFSAAYQPRPFSVTGTIIADSASQLRTNLDDLKVLLASLRGKRWTIPTPIKIEVADQTARYYPCHYVGGFEVIPIAPRPTSEAYASFSLPLVQTTPFAIATALTEAAPSGTGASFTVLDVGTAPCPCIVELEGAATAPDFVLTNMAFYWDADYSMVATEIDATTNTGTCGAATDSDQFEPGSFNKAQYLQLNSFQTSWSSLVQNNTEGTWLVYCRPQFTTDPGADVTVLEFYVDAGDYCKLWWDDSDDKWTFTKNKDAGGDVDLAESAASSHSSDDYMVLAVSYGADGMKVYKDGTLSNSNATTTGYTGASGTLYLGDQADAQTPDCNYEYVIGLPYQLADHEVARFSANPGLLYPEAVKKSKTNDLAANERSVLNFEDWTIDKIETDLTTTNDIGDWDTNGFPLLRPPAVCFYVPSGESIGGIKVAYLKRWL